eukprot:TRINITY_DN587_c4_g1_i1.p1 TRINITY_DN587_c4_g1~~TRINITY_DN587_c4_g1_i1.p1  ORF type:complete len:410 (+),score=77.47 TRINITY_DN587_c4_g1_i1:59-1288(+)
MSFVIDCGSDLYGTKHNIQLKLQHCPSLPELVAASESAFDVKARSCRPAGYPDQPFRIETFQLFDETLRRWVDLYDSAQLRSGCQLWCFQPESIWHSDAQGVIPDAEKNVATFTTPMGSHRRARIATDAGIPPTLSEKLRSVFYQVDGSNKGYITYEDLARAFQQCDMEFTQSSAGELFTMADTNRSHHITYDEWVSFTVKAPGIIDALFFRMRDMYQDRMPVGQSPPHIDAQINRQNELSSMYHSAFDDKRRHDAAYQSAKDRASRSAQEYEMAQANAQRALADHQQAQHGLDQAAAQHNAAQQSAQAAEAAALAASQRAAAQRASSQQALAYSSPPPMHHHGSPVSPMGGTGSPQRDQALREYEAARRRADEVRLAKEEAERDERNAWDRCYYAPGSPHYGPGSRGY